MPDKGVAFVAREVTAIGLLETALVDESEIGGAHVVQQRPDSSLLSLGESAPANGARHHLAALLNDFVGKQTAQTVAHNGLFLPTAEALVRRQRGGKLEQAMVEQGVPEFQPPPSRRWQWLAS